MSDRECLAVCLRCGSGGLGTLLRDNTQLMPHKLSAFKMLGEVPQHAYQHDCAAAQTAGGGARATATATATPTTTPTVAPTAITGDGGVAGGGGGGGGVAAPCASNATSPLCPQCCTADAAELRAHSNHTTVVHAAAAAKHAWGAAWRLSAIGQQEARKAYLTSYLVGVADFLHAGFEA